VSTGNRVIRMSWDSCSRSGLWGTSCAAGWPCCRAPMMSRTPKSPGLRFQFATLQRQGQITTAVLGRLGDHGPSPRLSTAHCRRLARSFNPATLLMSLARRHEQAPLDLSAGYQNGRAPPPLTYIADQAPTRHLQVASVQLILKVVASKTAYGRLDFRGPSSE